MKKTPIRVSPVYGAIYFEGKDIHRRKILIRRGPGDGEKIVIEADDKVECSDDACDTTHLDIIAFPDDNSARLAGHALLAMTSGDRYGPDELLEVLRELRRLPAYEMRLTFSAATLPDARPEIRAVTIPRDSLVSFRRQLGILVAFVGLVVGKAPIEVSMVDLMVHLEGLIRQGFLDNKKVEQSPFAGTHDFFNSDNSEDE